MNNSVKANNYKARLVNPEFLPTTYEGTCQLCGKSSKPKWMVVDQYGRNHFPICHGCPVNLKDGDDVNPQFVEGDLHKLDLQLTGEHHPFVGRFHMVGFDQETRLAYILARENGCLVKLKYAQGAGSGAPVFTFFGTQNQLQGVVYDFYAPDEERPDHDTMDAIAGEIACITEV